MYGRAVGKGATATIYEWGGDKVVKLFNQGYPKDAVQKEFRNARALSEMEFSKPTAHETVLLEGRMGIVYDKVQGESLLEWTMRTRDASSCAEYMADLHKAILRNSVSGVPNYKEFLTRNIENATVVSRQKREEALQLLGELPNGDTLCHGDFHPGNILISEGRVTVIDFMNVCHGVYLYDVARTVFLVEHTPLPATAGDKDEESISRLRRDLTEQYLGRMSVTRDMIQDYISVIAVARARECPDEQAPPR